MTWGGTMNERKVCLWVREQVWNGNRVTVRIPGPQIPLPALDPASFSGSPAGTPAVLCGFGDIQAKTQKGPQALGGSNSAVAKSGRGKRFYYPVAGFSKNPPSQVGLTRAWWGVRKSQLPPFSPGRILDRTRTSPPRAVEISLQRCLGVPG